jgi:hypothetical protein
MFGESSPDKVKAFLFLPDKSDNAIIPDGRREKDSERKDTEIKKSERKISENLGYK